MKRITIIGIVIAISGVCCVVAAYFSSYYYNLYIGARTDLEHRCENFERRIQYLESHKPKHLIPSHALAEISTTDRPPASDSFRLRDGDDNVFKLYIGKGDRIAPEFRIPAGSTNRQEFDIHFGSGNDAVVGAWLSHAEPYQDLALFDEFRAYRPHDTNVIRLVVQPKPGASFKFRFTLVVLHEY
jgi:hypothetical protein